MKLSVAALCLSASLFAPAALASEPAPAARYEVEVHVLEATKTVLLASTYVGVGSQAKVSLQGDQDSFDFSASLHAQEGDGAEDVLVSEVQLVRNGVTIASPSLMMKPNGTAQFQIGTEGQDELRVTIKPST